MTGKKRFSLEDIEVYSIAKALQENINLSDFRCEKQNFADYLRIMAIDDNKNDVAKVWLFVTHDKKVVSYVTLIMSQLTATFHPKLSKSTSHKFVPGILISEMATHIDYTGMGLGRLVIEWVVSIAFDLAQYAACRLIIVEAEPDKIEVYRHWGFEPIEDFEEKRYTMFLEISLRWAKDLMSIAGNVSASVRLGSDILFGNIDAFGKAFERAQRNTKEFSRINTNT